MLLGIFQNWSSWVTWVFSGVGVSALSGIGYLLYIWLAPKKNKDGQSSQSMQVSQDVHVDVHLEAQRKDAKDGNIEDKTAKKKYSQEELKVITNILFIDDESFKIVSILRKSEGWINTKSIKDIQSLSAPDIKWAHIIFVDVNGVGSALFNNQGLGVAQELKKRYPEKRVVLYSAESKHDAFSEAWDVVDARLPKNADPIMFITKVESLADSIFNHE